MVEDGSEKLKKSLNTTDWNYKYYTDIIYVVDDVKPIHQKLQLICYSLPGLLYLWIGDQTHSFKDLHFAIHQSKVDNNHSGYSHLHDTFRRFRFTIFRYRQMALYAFLTQLLKSNYQFFLAATFYLHLTQNHFVQMDLSTDLSTSNPDFFAHDHLATFGDDLSYLELYKGLLSNLLESFSESKLLSMISLLKGVNISNQAYFLKLLSMETRHDYHMINRMEEYLKTQENYHNHLLNYSKYLESRPINQGNKSTFPNKDDILSSWDKNRLIICGLTGSIGDYSPVMALGFQGKLYSKGPKWTNIITNKINETFYPIIRQHLDSFIIFYHIKPSGSLTEESEITVIEPSFDFNIKDCKIEYIIPKLDNKLYDNIIEASKSQIFLNFHDFSSCAKKYISNLYLIIEELKEWELNYPDWPKKSDENTLRGLASIQKSSELLSMVISLHIDVPNAIRNGLIKSVKSVTVEMAHSEHSDEFQSCDKLQNAIINRLPNGDKLVPIITQSIEYFKLT